ncbi:O-antigen ligase [Bacteroides sp. 519]|uniref:O-antigen ligase family protein n=1 Tax=Bacteroides sp. 519 TaxID=2302937 RepID=UPI0013D8A426|nr:O-antigen ligase family protein [Bacteroides sp. 519]NDV58983.1 O-antigen ligase domain-containing protein [Bacteroides sp. 519]
MEVFLTIYLLSGIIKAYLIFYNINPSYDITLLSGILALLVYFSQELYTNNGIIHVSNKRNYVIFSFMLFWLWMFISLIYTQSPEYSMEKTILFGTNIIPVFLISVKRDFNISLFLKSFFVVTLSLTVLYVPILFFYQTIGVENYESVNALYLILGISLGVCAVFLTTKEKDLFGKKVDRISSILSFFLLIMLGARGPLLFAVFCVLFPCLFKRKIHIKTKLEKKTITNILFFSLPFLLLIVILLCRYESFFEVFFERSFGRLSQLIDGFFGNSDMGESANARITHFESSLNILRNPSNFLFGLGIGSYGIVTSGSDGRLYPHNFILEIWTELGLIGVLLFFLFLSKTLYISKKQSHTYVTSALVIYTLLNLLKSSSLVDIRLFIAIWCMYWCNTNCMAKEKM